MNNGTIVTTCDRQSIRGCSPLSPHARMHSKLHTPKAKLTKQTAKLMEQLTYIKHLRTTLTNTHVNRKSTVRKRA